MPDTMGGLDDKRDRAPVRFITTDRVRELVTAAYAKAHLPYCCDPRDLAEGLGLEVRPANVESASIRDGVLRYPNRAKLPQRGMSIYLALARALFVGAESPGSDDDVLAAMLELALPNCIASDCPIAKLAKTQPNFPLSLLAAIYVTVHGSGVVTKNTR